MNAMPKQDDGANASRANQMISTAAPLTICKFIDGRNYGPRFTAENIRSAKAMIPRPDDIFICTYAKSGTTWIQHIVHQLMGKAEYDGNDDENGRNQVKQDSPLIVEEKTLWSISPMIEFTGATHLEKLESPRILKSHFFYEDIPKGGGAKYIYCCRNPKDVLTSYYHHHKVFKFYDFEGTFDEFFDLFMDGQVGSDDYFDNLLSWLDGIEGKEENILLLKYEDMVADLHSAVVEIGNFLGGNAAELIRDRQKLAKIVKTSTHSSMKKNQERWFPSKLIGQGEFIRKGRSRDWKNQFSLEQSIRMDDRFQKRLAGTIAAEWWQAEIEWNDNYMISPSVATIGTNDVA